MRAKFFTPDATLNLPVYLDAEVQAYLAARAQARGIEVEQLVNELLKKHIELLEALTARLPSLTSGARVMGDERAAVLVVDDDPSMRGALRNLVSSVGLDVRVFASPQDFLHAKRPDSPGCLVLDVRMLAMSGLAFQQELATIGIALPIVFITGHGDVSTTVRAMKAWAAQFLTKPLRGQELLDAIYSAIERDRARRKEAALVDQLRTRYDRLTEREIMKLIVAGRANKQIAADLELSCQSASRPGNAQDASKIAA